MMNIFIESKPMLYVFRGDNYLFLSILVSVATNNRSTTIMAIYVSSTLYHMGKVFIGILNSPVKRVDNRMKGDKSRWENPQKLSLLSTDLIQDISWEKEGTAQKDPTNDITSDGQVNSNFPYRWSPASQTFNIYFYLFLYLYNTHHI